MSLEEYMPDDPHKVLFEEIHDAIDIYLFRNDFKRARMYLEGVEEYLTVHEYVRLDDLINDYEAFDKRVDPLRKKRTEFYKDHRRKE